MAAETSSLFDKIFGEKKKVKKFEQPQHFRGHVGRKIFCSPDIDEAKRSNRSPEAFARWVQDQAVQDRHRRRCETWRAAFDEWLGCRRDLMVEARRGDKSALDFLANKLTSFGAHLIQSRPRIGRSTTILKYLIMASSAVPQLMRMSAVTRFLRGLQHVWPVLPTENREERIADIEKLMDLIREQALTSNFDLAVVLTALPAGLRLTEAVRIWSARKPRVTVEEGAIVWREEAQTKATLRGTRRLLPRSYPYPHDICRLVARALCSHASRTEAESAELWKEASRLLRRRGISRDVRAFRRTVAPAVAEAARALGKSETEAVAMARHALGHRPESTAIFRYLGGPATATYARELRTAQAAVRGTARSGGYVA